MMSLEFSIHLTIPATLWPWGKEWPACNADHLTAMCELTRKYGGLDISQPYGPAQPVMGVTLLLPIRTLRNHMLLGVVRKNWSSSSIEIFRKRSVRFLK
jgi:hypothetical protein